MSERNDAGGHRYAAADAELSGYFTASIGVRAQQYEGTGGGSFDSNESHTARLRAMRWLEARPSLIAWSDRVAGSLALLPPAMRQVLVMVYTPHGWPTWLASALATPWGGGSLVLLAATRPRAAEAAQKRNRGGDSASVLEWMMGLGRSNDADRVLGRIRDDAEVLRAQALAAYDVVRIARVKAEASAIREAKAKRSALGAQMFAEEMEMDRRIARARFERRFARKKNAA